MKTYLFITILSIFLFSNLGNAAIPACPKNQGEVHPTAEIQLLHKLDPSNEKFKVLDCRTLAEKHGYECFYINYYRTYVNSCYGGILAAPTCN